MSLTGRKQNLAVLSAIVPATKIFHTTGNARQRVRGIIFHDEKAGRLGSKEAGKLKRKKVTNKMSRSGYAEK